MRDEVDTMQAQGPAQHKQVQQLLNALQTDLEDGALSSVARQSLLDQVRMCTRSATNVKLMSTANHVRLLCRYSFDGATGLPAQTALKALANIMLLEPSARQIFVDSGYVTKAVKLLEGDGRDEQFLGSRLLFFTTYGTNVDLVDLVENHALASNIVSNIRWHENSISQGHQGREPMDDMALTESLKLLFNLSQFCPQAKLPLKRSIAPILKMLIGLKIQSPPLQPPLSSLINALLNLDLDPNIENGLTHSLGLLFPDGNSTCYADHLTYILDLAVHEYKEGELEENAVPLATLLHWMHTAAPPEVRSSMKSRLLPSDTERVKPLGQSDTLPAFLLRLMISPVAPSLGEAISNLLFELSDHDAGKLVRNVGYGFAAGYLMSHNISLPEGALEEWKAADLEASKAYEDGPSINPITGQRRDMEDSESDDDRTEDEKLREAEKLFVLFERLRATGIVDVQNPVAQAVQEGRFEELE